MVKVILDLNGDIVFLGQSGNDAELFRVNPTTGAFIGAAQLPPNSGSFLPIDFCELANGNFAIAGAYISVPGNTSSWQSLLIGVHANLGSILWGNEYRGNANSADWLNAVTQATNGEIVAVGAQRSGTFFHDGTFYRFNSTTGALLSASSYQRTNLDRNEGFGGIVQIPATNDFIILGAEKDDNSGSEANYNSTNIKLTRVDGTGAFVWERKYQNNGVATGEHDGEMRILGNELILCGITNKYGTNPATNGSNAGSQVYLMAVNFDGVNTWSKLNRINTANSANTQVARMVVTNNAVITGASANNRPFAGETGANSRNFLFAEDAVPNGSTGCLHDTISFIRTNPGTLTVTAVTPVVVALDILGEAPAFTQGTPTILSNNGCLCTEPVVNIISNTGAAGCNNTLTVGITNATFPVTVNVVGSNGGNSFTVTANSSPFTITGLCPGSYLTNFSSGACSTAISYSVENVCQGFNVDITAINLAFPLSFPCGSNVDILIGGGAASLPAQVQTNWVGGGAASPLIANTNAFNIPGECVQDYTTIITNVLGCRDTLFYTIPSCVDTAICVGSSIILSAWDNKFHAPFGSGNQITGNWLVNGVQTASGATLTINPTANTNYIFNGALYNLVNGVSTFVQFVNFCVNVTLTTPPQLTATATPTTICAGQTTTLSVAGGPGNAIYRWFRAPGFNLGTGTTKVVSPSVTTQYYVIVDCAACTDTAEVTVNVVQPQQATISGPSNICGTQSVTLTGSGGSSYIWKLMPAGTTVGTSPTLTQSVNSTRTYQLTANNAPCPSTTATHTIALNAPPAIALVTPANACRINGQTVTMTANSSNISTWVWGNTPSAPSGISTSPSTSSANYVLGPGNNVISVTGISAANCTTTVNTTIAAASPVININNTAGSACNNRVFTATVSGTNANTGTPSTYSWVFRNLTQNTSNSVISNTPTNSASQTFAAPGIDQYQVCVFITMTNGCIISNCITPTLAPCSCNIAADFCTTVGAPITVGTASNVVFNPNVTGGAGLTYEWVWGDGTPNTVVTNANNITHNYAQNAGNVTAELIVTGTINGMQCCQRVSHPVNIPVPCGISSTNFSGFRYNVNATGTISFLHNSTPPTTGYTYFWNFGNNMGTSTASQPTYTYPAAGTYNVCLTVTHVASGCTRTFCQEITAPNTTCRLVPHFTATRCTNTPLTVEFGVVNVTTGGAPTNISYVWNFGDNSPLQSTTSATTNYTYSSTGTYTVCLQKITPSCTTQICRTIVIQNPSYTNCSPALTGLKTQNPNANNNLSIEIIGENLSRIEMAPNPAQNISNLLFSLKEEKEVTIEAYTLDGKKVWEKAGFFNEGEHSQEISLNGWTPGVYIIRATAGEEVQNFKLLVE